MQQTFSGGSALSPWLKSGLSEGPRSILCRKTLASFDRRESQNIFYCRLRQSRWRAHTQLLNLWCRWRLNQNEWCMYIRLGFIPRRCTQVRKIHFILCKGMFIGCPLKGMWLRSSGLSRAIGKYIWALKILILLFIKTLKILLTLWTDKCLFLSN